MSWVWNELQNVIVHQQTSSDACLPGLMIASSVNDAVSNSQKPSYIAHLPGLMKLS